MAPHDQKSASEPVDPDSPGEFQFFDKAFDAVAEAALSFYHVPGLAIGVTHKGKTYAKGYGYSNLESQTPVEPTTLFYAGSTTKSFTAAALSLLISKSSEYGNIDWTTPISSVIPDDFVLSDEWVTKHITFEDAFCHRTGYPRHDLCYGGPEETSASLVRRLRHMPMTAEPRTRWQYQNIMWVAASVAVEKLTGQPYKDFVRENIWEPLGMKSTFLTHDDALEYVKTTKDGKTSITTPYLWIPHDQANFTPSTTVSEGDHFAEIAFDLPALISGAGCNITSVLDYCKYLDCMIRQAPPFPPAAHAELRRQRIPIFDPSVQVLSGQAPLLTGPPQYCLGWFHEVYAPKGTTTTGGIEIWKHGGDLHGFETMMRYIPALELGIVTMGNAGPGAQAAGESLIWDIVNNMLGVKQEARFDWKAEYLAQEQANAQRLTNWSDRLFGELASKLGKMTATLQAHEGVFEHPAYQQMTVSVAQRPSPSKGKPAEEPYLLVTASPRVWNFSVELRHVHEEMFMAQLIIPYPEGKETPDAGHGRIEDRARAMFKLGPDGGVRRLGIELEPMMVAKAEEDAGSKGKQEAEKAGERDRTAVEQGMIWFERVSS